MKVVDLADEFGLTTSEAIDACLWAGVPADSSATELTSDDAKRVRDQISGWIDAGFVPWRSGDQHPGAGRTSAHASSEAAGPNGPGTSVRGGDGSTTTLDPPASRDRSDGTAPPSGAGAPVVGTADPADELPAPIRKSAAEAGDFASGPSAPIGPRLPPSRGGPTGWLPGGPDANPRVAPLAVVALALAIASLVVPFVTAVLAIVLASMAKDRIARSRGWSKGTNIATAAQVVAGVGIGLWMVLLVGQLLYLQDKTRNQDYSDIQVDLATVGYGEVKIGDCVRLPKTGDISDWTLVSCDASHRAEVFAQLPIANAAGLSYPGDAPIQSAAKADCRAKLSQYMQDPLEEQSIETGFAYPSPRTWREESDRTIWCVAFRKDGTMLGKSIKSPNVAVVTTTTAG